MLCVAGLARADTLSGTVVDQNRNRVAGARVIVCRTGSTSIPFTPVLQTTFTATDGACLVTIAARTYDITIERTGIVSTKLSNIATSTILPYPLTIANLIATGTGTLTGLMQCKNFENVLCADQFMGTGNNDVGDKLNAANGTSAGSLIWLPRNPVGGSWLFSTPIAFATAHKPLQLSGLGVAGTANFTPAGSILEYTPTTNTCAVTLDYTDSTGSGWATGHGLSNLGLWNNHTWVIGGTGSLARGICFGSTNGSGDAVFRDLLIAGHGKGVDGGSTGMEVIFNICQDNVGSRTFNWPANALNAPAVLPNPNACTIATFANIGLLIWTNVGINSNLAAGAPIGSNNAFTENNAFAGTTGLNGGGNFTGTFTGNPTMSGNPIFRDTPSFTGSGNTGKLGLGATALGAANTLDGTCYVDGVTNTTLAAAITCAGSAGTIQVPPIAGTLSVPTSVTIPAGVTLRVDQGAKLSIAAGQTLTINGPLQIGDYQAFVTQATGSPIAITAASESTSGSAIAITAASETGNIVTITSTLNPGIGSTVIVSGVTPSGYNSSTNGGWTVLTSSASAFTYFNTRSGLGAGTVFGTAQFATNTVTITSTLSAVVGVPVTISGVTPSNYNGTYLVLTTNAGVSFTVYSPIAGMGAGSAFGTATMGGAVKFGTTTEAVVRPEWFGAVADGSNSTPISGTDNYVAFLMAQNTLPAYYTPTQGTFILKNGQLSTGGRLLLSQGRYVVSSTLQWSPFTTYECPSYRGCMIALKDAVAASGPEMWVVDLAATFFGGVPSPNTSYGGQFRNIHIDCNGGYFYGTNTRSSGLQFNGAQGASLGSLWIQNCGNRGFWLANNGGNSSGVRGPSDLEVLGVTVGPGVQLDGNSTYFSSINSEQVNLNGTYLDADGDPNPNVLIGSASSGGCFNCNIIMLGTEFGGLPLKIWNGQAINILNLALQPIAAGQPTGAIISHGAASVTFGPLFTYASSPQLFTNFIVDRTATPTANISGNFQNFPSIQGYSNAGSTYLKGSTNIRTLLASSTAPTIAAAGCGGGAARIDAGANGTAVFSFNVGTTPGTSCTITLPRAANRWSCNAFDYTSPNAAGGYNVKQTGGTVSTAVFTFYNTAGTATAPPAGDHVSVTCSGG